MMCCASREGPNDFEEKDGALKKKNGSTNGGMKNALSSLKGDIAKASNGFTKSAKFKGWVTDVFDSVDLDKSGHLCNNEVYIAVLLLYLKINGVCKGAAPPPRGKVDDLFRQFDADNSGFMDALEFEDFAAMLASQIATRVIIQMFLQSAVAPALGLLVLYLWGMLAEIYFPDMYAYCSHHIPPALAVTIVVTTAVSQLVPPMMNFIDKVFTDDGKDSGGKKKK